MTPNSVNSINDKQLESLLRAAMSGNDAPDEPATAAKEQSVATPEAPKTEATTTGPALTVQTADTDGADITRSKAAVYKDIEPARPNGGNAQEHKANASKPKNGGKKGDKKAKDEDAKKADDKPSFRDFVKQQANEDYSFPKGKVTLRKILGGDILDTAAVRRQIWVMLIITAFIFVYITNRYSCQRYLITIDKLNSELIDAKYKALSTSSQLTERSRESRVLEMLKDCKDSTLHIADQPPYIITVPDDADNLIK